MYNMIGMCNVSKGSYTLWMKYVPTGDGIDCYIVHHLLHNQTAIVSPSHTDKLKVKEL